MKTYLRIGLIFCFGLLARTAFSADIGVEAVKYFSHFNDTLDRSLNTLYYSFDVSDGLWEGLNTGEAHNFYFTRGNCWEKDLREVGQGGWDHLYGDNVDLFFIITHGGNWDDSLRVTYDIDRDGWHSDSRQWQLGNGDLEWLALYACSTLPFGVIETSCTPFFYGLHMVLGAHDKMWLGPSTAECGEDFAQNLKDGDTVCDAWLDGVSDWFFDQNPIVVSGERYETYRGGAVDWPNLVLSRDHYPGRGTTCLDIPHSRVYHFVYRWVD